jgi:putrescine carbamoyltransferase
MHFTQASPRKYQAPDQWVGWARENCATSGGSLTLTEDPVAAVSEADYIYTDLWWWVGQEDQIPERRAAFMPRYQVNLELFERAPAHCQFMHCLPASRGVEATDEVMDHPRSIIFDQSENRLHTEKGLLVYLLYPRLKRPAPETLATYQRRIEGLLKTIGERD